MFQPLRREVRGRGQRWPLETEESLVLPCSVKLFFERDIEPCLIFKGLDELS
jgi:hypothetical protein